MALIITDIQELFQRTFGKPYRIDGEAPQSTGEVLSDLGNHISTKQWGKYGQELFLPVKFYNLDKTKFGDTQLLLPYCVIKISGKKTIVKTPLAERKGTVKELFSIEDYVINIKGFVIDESRVWPEKEVRILRNLHETSEAVYLDNALTNIFLVPDKVVPGIDEDNSYGRVVIESLELPEVEGGRNHVRPFSMTLESDSVFTLEVDDNV